MTEEVRKLQEERQLINDQLYACKIPKRLMCNLSFTPMYLMQWKNIDPVTGQYHYSVIRDAAIELCRSIYTDTSPVHGGGTSTRFPANMQLLDSRTMRMGANGFMQHPNVKGMEADEYDELLKDPFAFLAEKVVPRLYPGIDPNDAISTYRNIAMADAARAYDMSALNGIISELNDEYGWYKGAPAGSGGFSAAPFDFLADQVRSFSETMIDVRRDREKVKAACEALLPLMFKMGMPSKPHQNGSVSTPLHMAMYMRLKDVEELWFPTYKILCEQFAARGARVSAFLEQNWDKLLDIADELPTAMILKFEIADMKVIKEKIGKKHIIGTNFPINLLRFGTKEECIIAARQMLDDTMEGGGMQFGFDKGSFTYGGVNFENCVAVMDTVHKYGVYDNPGEDSIVKPLNYENFAKDESLDKPIVSKYAFNWDEYKAKYPMAPDDIRERLEKYDNDVMKKYMALLT